LVGWSEGVEAEVVMDEVHGMSDIASESEDSGVVTGGDGNEPGCLF